jgi:hypothetical protein
MHSVAERQVAESVASKRGRLSQPGTPAVNPLIPDAVYTRREVAAWLKVRPRQVERMGVPCLDLGRRTKRYLGSDVLAWLERLRSSLTS